MFSSWPEWRREEDPFWRVQEGGHILRLCPRALGCHKRWKVCPFLSFEIILLLLCLLLKPLTQNKYCRTWIFLINLWIDSKTRQKKTILLSARQRSKNYLELSKEKVLGYMMLSHWPCFTWKFFVIWFHKILKFIF